MLAATPDSPVGRRLGTLAVGLVLVSSGVALMIRAELGVAPYDVLTTGLAALTGLPIGVAAVVTPLLFATLGWLLGRRPGPGTVLAVALVGPLLGVVLSALPNQEAMVPRIVLFGAGFLAMAAGITAVIVRTAIEVVCVVVGWAIGGQVGVGTVVVAVLIGPTLRRMLTATGFDATRAQVATDTAAPGA